jgi:hypothetical protein
MELAVQSRVLVPPLEGGLAARTLVLGVTRPLLISRCFPATRKITSLTTQQEEMGATVEVGRMPVLTSVLGQQAQT